MSKMYNLKFGSGKASGNTGLTPTFTIFSVLGLTAIQAPAITELPAGSGIYQYFYNPTLAITIEVDGGSGLSANDRYIYGTLDPVQAVDQSIGLPTDAIGSTSTGPTTLFGFSRRLQNFNEGDALFIKSTGAWYVSSIGSSILLMTKTLTNSVSQATKS